MGQQLRFRLRQEAQLISKLNHPGICTLYDVRQHDGIDYLVMEFLEGETLAKRLSRGPVALHDAVQIALDILSALEYAHRQGVIHRDIKPGNVMLVKGNTKLLDFGIAKFQELREAPDELRAPGPATPMGLALGTPPYMAPEQREGGIADVKSDIYAFGVTFCALLGAPIDGSFESSVHITKLQEPFRQIVAKCLKVDPSERWHDAGDLRAVLKLISEQPILEQALLKNSKRLKIVALSAVLGAISAIAAFTFMRPHLPDRGPIEFQMLPPTGSQFPTIEQAGPPVISPDGNELAFVARDQTGQEKLWLRRMDSVSALPLTGTEEASHPFWSPDSRTIGFFARNQLMSIDIDRGIPKIICEAHDGRGGTWVGNDVIIFSPGFIAPLYRVPATGGVPVAITSLNMERQENSHRWPEILPDGKHLLYVVRALTRENSGLYVGTLDGGAAKRIGGIESSAVYVPGAEKDSGHLIYTRGSQIVTQPFSMTTLELGGEAVTIADLGWVDTSTTRVPVSVSTSGVLVYGGGQTPISQVVWYSIDGKELSRINYTGITRFLRLSPDARTIAIERLDFRFGSGSLWFLGAESPVPRATRFTFDPVSSYTPVWSPDGQYVAYAVHTGKTFELVVAPIDGSSMRVLMTSPQSEPIEPTDWTKSGLVIYEMKNANTGWDLRAVSPQDPEKHTVLLNSAAQERLGRMSPDGVWLAYTSTEDGTEQVYVHSVSGSAARLQVSTAGGSQPVWSRDSTDLFFVDRDRMLMRSHIDVRIKRATVATPLFRLPPATDPGMMDGWEYDVSSDDRKFLTVWRASSQESKPVTVVSGWKLASGR